MTTTRPSPSIPTVAELEQTLLRRFWWAFPVLGACASLAVGGPFWAWAEGAPVHVEWANLWSWRSAIWAVAFGTIPLVWALGLRVRFNRGWVAALAVLLFAGMEAASKSSLAQTAFWLSARARLEPSQHFMREVCYVRLEELAPRPPATPGVMVIGSSQILNGVDTPLIRRELAPVPVIRRAMFGMTPLKALAMSAYMPFQTGDLALLYLSEFDFTNQDPFPFSWIRPYASWKTLPAVFQSLPRRTRLWQWRHMTDVALAASLPGWQSRDFTRQIVRHFWRAPAPASAVAAAATDDRREALVQHARGELKDALAEYRAFYKFADSLARRGVRMVIFEGEVSDAIYTPSRHEKKEQVRRVLSALCAGGNHRYVSRTEQGIVFQSSDWSDMTHLNAAGREKITRRMMEVLREEFAESDAVTAREAAWTD